jgi:hypothetical protein
MLVGSRGLYHMGCSGHGWSPSPKVSDRKDLGMVLLLAAFVMEVGGRDRERDAETEWETEK